MPMIHVQTNQTISKEQETSLKEQLGEAIALIPGKSESWLMLDIEDNHRMYFRGDNTEPIAYVEVKIFGGSDPEAFRKMTAEVTKILGTYLGIAPDHIYIRYQPSADWGWNGNNF